MKPTGAKAVKQLIDGLRGTVRDARAAAEAGESATRGGNGLRTRLLLATASASELEDLAGLLASQAAYLRRQTAAVEAMEGIVAKRRAGKGGAG